MKLTSIALFGVGYVLGAKAGRERYAEIVESVRKASQSMEGYRNGGKPSERLATYLRDTAGQGSHS